MLFDPAPLISSLGFELAGHDTHIGRSLVRAHATLRDGGQQAPEVLQELGLGADQYELDVDEELGVLLRLSASIDGNPIFALTVEELSVDEDLPEELFRFEAPAGTEITDAADIQPPAGVTLEEAAAEASFTVVVPHRVPERASLHVSYQRGSARPRLVEQVYLVYAFVAGEHTLVISETAAGQSDEPAADGWIVMETDGVTVRHRDHGPQRDVEIERLGTRARISSDLDLALLVELALSLEPAPTEPPALRDA